MILLRILGVWFVLVAMVAIVVDATKGLANDQAWTFTALGAQWAALNPQSLKAAQTAVETSVSPFLWDPVIVWLLQLPTWAVFGGLGLLLYWIGRKRRPREVYTN